MQKDRGRAQTGSEQFSLRFSSLSTSTIIRYIQVDLACVRARLIIIQTEAARFDTLRCHKTVTPFHLCDRFKRLQICSNSQERQLYQLLTLF